MSFAAHQSLRDRQRSSRMARCSGNLWRLPALPCCAVALFVAICSSHAETVWLSSLDLSQMTSGWGVAKTDSGVAGTPIKIGGKEFANGVGTHAESRFRVDVRGKATRF